MARTPMLLRWFCKILLVCLCLLNCSCAPIGHEKQVQGNLYASYNVSPDGRRVVIGGAGNGGKDIYLFNLATRVVTRVTNTQAYENYPAFSPDGQQIVYQSAPSLESSRCLYIRSLASNKIRQLTYGANIADFSPAYSHDGKQIVFSRAVNYHGDKRGEETWSGFDVYVINVNGTHLRRLSHGLYNNFIRPVFSPDDRHVLFERITGGAENDDEKMAIYQITFSSNAPPQPVIQYTQFASAPAYFPDSKHVVFVGNDDGPDLYVSDLIGGKPVCLNTVRYSDGSGGHDPKVSDNGRYIYFLIGYDNELWRMDSDGLNSKRIATSSLFSDPTAYK